jgi:hypothetical protein
MCEELAAESTNIIGNLLSIDEATDEILNAGAL